MNTLYIHTYILSNLKKEKIDMIDITKPELEYG